MESVEGAGCLASSQSGVGDGEAQGRCLIRCEKNIETVSWPWRDFAMGCFRAEGGICLGISLAHVKISKKESMLVGECKMSLQLSWVDKPRRMCGRCYEDR